MFYNVNNFLKTFLIIYEFIFWYLLRHQNPTPIYDVCDNTVKLIDESFYSTEYYRVYRVSSLIVNHASRFVQLCTNLMY